MKHDLADEIVVSSIKQAELFVRAVPMNAPMAATIIGSLLLVKFTAVQMGLSKMDVQRLLVDVFDNTGDPEVFKR